MRDTKGLPCMPSLLCPLVGALLDLQRCSPTPMTCGPQISKLTSQLEYDRRADLDGAVVTLEHDLAAEQAAQDELKEVGRAVRRRAPGCMGAGWMLGTVLVNASRAPPRSVHLVLHHHDVRSPPAIHARRSRASTRPGRVKAAGEQQGRAGGPGGGPGRKRQPARGD